MTVPMTVPTGLLPLADVPADDVLALARDCLAERGGLPLLGEPAFVEHQLGSAPGAGWYAAGRLAGAVAARPDGTSVSAALLVAPSEGSGAVLDELLGWLDAAHPATTVDLRCESADDEVRAALARHGYDTVTHELVMRAPTDGVEPPADVVLVPWADAAPRDFFETYVAAFRERPGFPGWSLEEWVEWTADDDDFDDRGTALALAADGSPAGFVSVQADCLVQVGVRPEHRGGDTGPALVRHARRSVGARGHAHVWLTVAADNDRAVRRYLREGFVRSGERVRVTRGA